MKQDSVGGLSYYQLLTGPYSLGEIAETEQRYLTKMPSWANTGATWSWWYRHIPCPDKPSCGGYIFYPGDFLYWKDKTDVEANAYWSLWIEDEGIWIDSPGVSTHLWAW